VPPSSIFVHLPSPSFTVLQDKNAHRLFDSVAFVWDGTGTPDAVASAAVAQLPQAAAAQSPLWPSFFRSNGRIVRLHSIRFDWAAFVESHGLQNQNLFDSPVWLVVTGIGACVLDAAHPKVPHYVVGEKVTYQCNETGNVARTFESGRNMIPNHSRVVLDNECLRQFQGVRASARVAVQTARDNAQVCNVCVHACIRVCILMYVVTSTYRHHVIITTASSS
jgi:hypothetical protein